ncbi:MAG: hypothetical protein IPM60_14360 [Rhodospirillales bacterium]|nr:hypothetical protein [Rhodospirillales bacterium]
MEKLEEFVDERQKSWCIQCGAWIGEVETNEDHVPSRALLLRPHPPNLPVVRVCATCNNGFSADEEYLFLFLRCVLAGTTDPDGHEDARVARALKHHDKLRARIERSKIEYRTIGGETRAIWQPESERVNRVVVKSARGLAFYEYGEPKLTEPERVWTAPLDAMSEAERESFENAEDEGMLAGWPEVGSRMMTRVMTGEDLCDGWIVVQDGVYRYRVNQCGTIRVRSVLFEYLATEVCWDDCT